ncbi:MAG: hypothetical protein HY252_12945 [Sphingobacteriales bacterium]|nr:hypothetical protein [Sphingobacteriales bacterium]
MKTTKFILSLTVVFSLLFVGCKKYPDGPAFSIKTAKARITRQWKEEKTIASNGTTTTPPSTDNSYTEFKSDGTLITSSNGLSINGTWAFSSDKKMVSITVAVPFFGSITESSTILRLTSKELWLKDVSNDEIHYIAK